MSLRLSTVFVFIAVVAILTLATRRSVLTGPAAAKMMQVPGATSAPDPASVPPRRLQSMHILPHRPAMEMVTPMGTCTKTVSIAPCK